MRKIVSMAFAMVSMYGSLYAQQQNSIKFEKTFHDFGVVKEGDPAVVRYSFKNVGTDTIVLTHSTVRASCGCTTPSFTTTSVLPGDTGSVTASFGTAGRPNTSTKTVTVTHKSQSYVLKFRVFVQPRTADTSQVQKIVATANSPKLLLPVTDMLFEDSAPNAEVTKEFVIKNMGKDSLKIVSAKASCYGNCISYRLFVVDKKKKKTEVKALPTTKKKTSAVLEVKYKVGTELGYDEIKYNLTTNDPTNKDVAIRLYGKVVQVQPKK